MTVAQRPAPKRKPAKRAASRAGKAPAKRAASSAGKAPAKRAASPPGKAPSIDRTSATLRVAARPARGGACDPALSARQLAKVRAVALALPDATERPSHGSPSFYLGGKHAFMYFCDNHHHDGRLALWCAAPLGAQSMLVDSNPDVYFLPPYVAHLGWIGVRLDRDAGWSEIAAVIEAAHHTRSTRKR